MSFGKTKLFVSFALLGFLIGSAAYYVFDWVLANLSIVLWPIPILEIITAPWFISGIAGSLLLMAVLLVSARFTGEK